MLEHSDVVFSSHDQYRRIIERMVAAVGRRVDESSPMVDARLADGSRINAIVPPLAVKAPVLTIRKFPERPLSMQDLIEKGSVSLDAAEFLEACVRGRISLVVVGGTGTGKTTMLNVLSDYIPDGERLITIEESAELQLRAAHTVTLETRPSNAEGSGEVRIRDLVRNSLRMRPDRIIVGECRGAETLDMLQAMNTGHPGSMTTVHANTPREVLARLETMVLMGGVELPQRAIREQIVMAVGLIVQLQRTVEGARVISSITEIQGMEGDTVLLQDVFHRVGMAEGSGHLAPTGTSPEAPRRAGAQRRSMCRPSLFRNDVECRCLGESRQAGRHHRPARPGRVVEPPSDDSTTALAAAGWGVEPVNTLQPWPATRCSARGGRRLHRGWARHHGGGPAAAQEEPSSARWPRSWTTPWGWPTSRRGGERGARARRAVRLHRPILGDLRSARHPRRPGAAARESRHSAAGREFIAFSRHRLPDPGRGVGVMSGTARRRHCGRLAGRGGLEGAGSGRAKAGQADAGAAAGCPLADGRLRRRWSDVPALHRHVPARCPSPLSAEFDRVMAEVMRGIGPGGRPGEHG